MFEAERLAKLKSKGVKKVFIRADDEASYLAYMDQGLDTLLEPQVEISKKGEVAHDSLVTEAENIDRSLETEQGYKQAEKRVGKVIEFLASDKGALKSVMDSAGCSKDFSQHGANVASLSLALAMRLGGFSSRELFDLAIAALVHDLGKVELNLSPWVLRESLSPEEVTRLRKHPQATVDALAAKRFITPGILRLVLEHEELGDGQGYPERKRLSSMPISSQVLNLCNDFDRDSMAKGVPAGQLMKEYFQTKAHLFDLNHLQILGEIIAGR